MFRDWVDLNRDIFARVFKTEISCEIYVRGGSLYTTSQSSYSKIFVCRRDFTLNVLGK